MIDDGRLTHGFHINRVVAGVKTIRSKISLVKTSRKVANRHEILLVTTDEHGVMVNRVFVPGDAPAQLAARDSRVDAQTVVDAALDLGSLFVVIPGDELKHWQLV